MIEFGREYYDDNKYFFLKKRKNTVDVYFSVSNTISEARTMEEIISIPLIHETITKLVVEKILKSKKRFSKKDIKNIMNKISPEKDELEELVDFDGSFSNSKVPIHDPTLSPTKTMDQTVFATRQAGNPLLRGYRVYYGESLEDETAITEIDAHVAFGFDETELEGENAKEAIETFKELGVEDPVGRAKEMGYDPKLEKKKLPGSFTRKRLKEVQKEKMIKVLEDMVTKKSKNTDVQSKEINASKLLMKNLKTLKKMADKEGLSNSDILKLLKYE
jgi:hypothetical protein